ncbi:metallophosphoesterase family protein [Nocardia wallacei]|uniref:metallophosphoesterase family protein n=1 Tax=Nocardia wallacei TaxID=480035 RepID=UPI002458D768|nr:metallophosphoesterase [Nocardia wallacei]
MTAVPTCGRMGGMHGGDSAASASGHERTRVRIAAVADLHMRESVRGRFGPALRKSGEHADLLLLAGDLTDGGAPDEAELLCAELAEVPVPMAAVLGNHDHDRRQGYRIAATLAAAGVRVLDGTATTFDCAGVRVGVAGVMGGSGGFPGCAGDPDSGSAEHRERYRRGPADALRLRAALDCLDTDVRIALMHFSPVLATLAGEPARILPGLGCAELGDAADAGRANLVLHGHAHGGTECGETPGGVPVRNVSYPVIRASYRVYEVSVD